MDSFARRKWEKEAEKRQNSSLKIRMGVRTFRNIWVNKKSSSKYHTNIYYNLMEDTRVKCDASHSGLGATLEQKEPKRIGNQLRSRRDI